MYTDRIKHMEANLKQVLDELKAEQRRRVLVETQLLAQAEAVNKLFSKEPHQSLGSLGQQDLSSGSHLSVSRDAQAAVSTHAACQLDDISGLRAGPEKSTQKPKGTPLGSLLPMTGV